MNPMESPQTPRATPDAHCAPVPVTRTYSRRRSNAKRSHPDPHLDRDHQHDPCPDDENLSQELDPAARLELRQALLGIASSPSSSLQATASAASTEALTEAITPVGPSKPSKKPRTTATKGPLDAFFLIRKPPPASSPPSYSAASSATPVPTAVAPLAHPNPPAPKRLVQSRLNFGQRNQGATRCSDCGMHYLPTSESDRKLHAKFHKASQLGIEYPGYRSDLVLATTPTYRILHHAPFPATSTKPVHLKLAAIHAHVDAALGAAPTDPQSTTTYLAIHHHAGRPRLFGALIMDALPVRAWRVASPDQPVDLSEPTSSGQAVGVSRVWVDAACTRKGVASALLDAMRERTGTDRDRVAFSQPTEAGWALATKWVGKAEVLVYY